MIKDKVTSLELAKQLKEAGYPQEGLFKWCVFDNDPKLYENEKTRLFTKDQWESFVEDYIPPKSDLYVAPLSCELGEWLPKYTAITKEKGYWLGDLTDTIASDSGYDLSDFEEDTEANARARMLIWLVENKYVEFN